MLVVFNLHWFLLHCGSLTHNLFYFMRDYCLASMGLTQWRLRQNEILYPHFWGCSPDRGWVVLFEAEFSHKAEELANAIAKVVGVTGCSHSDEAVDLSISESTKVLVVGASLKEQAYQAQLNVSNSQCCYFPKALTDIVQDPSLKGVLWKQLRTYV